MCTIRSRGFTPRISESEPWQRRWFQKPPKPSRKEKPLTPKTWMSKPLNPPSPMAPTLPTTSLTATPNSKRGREEAGEGEDANDAVTKKQKVEKSVEEERLEKLEAEVVETGRFSLGPKTFGSSVRCLITSSSFCITGLLILMSIRYIHGHVLDPAMMQLDCRTQLVLGLWLHDVFTFADYEHMMLLDLLKKGHTEPDKKIGGGIHAFQVRYHPVFKSRCFFVIRDDESVDDFSFRKCVDHISPLPENMKAKSEVNKALGGGRGGKGGGGGGRGGGRGRGGRGGRGRN
ncbi:Protein embryo defective 514 [Vitis vinifera]|uniref:Protein embryo defective 514 n=1 Tax=Vitis vinifera TaxID=29760 RepID=A0A438BM53_VITVI|nr:Protein embryo defective 514 [Vitis vinifera]